MKKILLTSIATVVCCVNLFGQGEIIFENTLDSSAGVTINSPSGPSTGSGLVVDLFWYNSAFSSFVLEDTFTSTFTGAGNASQYPGHFNAGELTIPQSGAQTFMIEAFYTAGFGISYMGTSGPFTAPVNVLPNGPGHTEEGSWDGNMVVENPEPSTLALGGLGAAVLLLFHRRK